MPVIPATWEAEVVELLEPRRRRLQIVPLHSSLGNRETDRHTHTHTHIYTHTEVESLSTGPPGTFPCYDFRISATSSACHILIPMALGWGSLELSIFRRNMAEWKVPRLEGRFALESQLQLLSSQLSEV